MKRKAERETVLEAAWIFLAAIVFGFGQTDARWQGNFRSR